MHKLDHCEIDIKIAKIPTHSSDWLNMMRLTTLYQFQQSPEYKRALQVHFKSQQDEDNALFEAMHQLVTNTPSRSLKLLDQYPLLTDNRQIVNPTQSYSLIKGNWHAQTKEPIPIYKRGFHYNIWKKNPFKSIENPNQEPTINYPGLDFLIAYHLAQIKPQPINKPTALVVEDRKTQRDKIVAHLKAQGYQVLQAGWLEEAKQLAPKADLILTDYDLKKLGGLQAQNDGMQFLQWLRKQIDNNQINPKEVIMHSTLFDNEDIPSKLFGKAIRKKVESLGFKNQPKKVISQK